MQSRTAQVPSGGEIRALTGLRGVAAAYVVLYHMLQDTPGDGPGATAIRHGYIAVDLFFLLSGFVLAMVHGNDRFDRAGYAAFLRKRLARTYPLYGAVTLVTLGLCTMAGATVSPVRLLVNAALLQGWGLGTAILPPSWSLSAEFAAYLLFPLLVTALLRGSGLRALACAAGAFALLWVISRGGPEPRSGPLDLYQGKIVAPLLRCLGGFVLGLAAFRLRQCGTARRFRTPWASTGIGLAIVALLPWHRSDLAIVALMVPFVIALSVADGGLAGRLLASAPLHRLGVLSFSIYLVHFPIREWLRPVLVAWLHGAGAAHADGLATLAACGATLAVASLTYRLIERPARSMVRARFRLVPNAP